MSGTIDAIAERTSPSRIVGRQRRRMSDRVHHVREVVMGTADEAYGTTQDRARGMVDAVQERAGSIADTAGAGMHKAADEIRQIPEAARYRTQGSPLAAGLIAFGAGALAAAVVPSSRTERQAASRIQAGAEPMVQELMEVGQQVVESVKGNAQQAVHEVKDSATDAARQVADETKGAAKQVEVDAKGNARRVVDDARQAPRDGQGQSTPPSFPAR
jgi:gas vesicle protein